RTPASNNRTAPAGAANYRKQGGICRPCLCYDVRSTYLIRLIQGVSMADLFDSIALRGLTLPNRVIVSPMCQYSAVNGNATEWHMAHLGGLGLGGMGLLFVEATAVSAEGRITPGCLG